MSTTLERVAKVFQDVFDWDTGSLTPVTGPEHVPPWDSLGHMRLVLALEEEFGCRFEVDDIMEMTSVARIVHVVEKAPAIQPPA